MLARRFYPIQTFIISVFLIACAAGPYSKTNKVHKKQLKSLAKTIRKIPPGDSLSQIREWVGTTNFGLRKPNFVIIHHTAQNSCDQTLRTFTLTRTRVSAHYVICKDGSIFHMLNDYLRAWHAGVSKWGNNNDINSSSIGIELDNNGFETFPDAQMNSLLLLLNNLKKGYDIPNANFIGHGDIAPTRKNDPNWRFSWKQLADLGFGIWYDDTTNVIVPDYFDQLQALRIIGYDLKDTIAATIAFKRHFLQDTTRNLSESDRKVLFAVSNKFLR